MKRRRFLQHATLATIFWRPALAGTKQANISDEPAFDSLASPISSLEAEPDTGQTIIKVIGVGGAGCNAVNSLRRRGFRGVDFLAADTDAGALKRCLASTSIQLGSSGFGAGAQPEVGRAAALESQRRIADALRGAHMVFIVAGMGGGTGTGAAPVIAELASSLGALPVAVVTMPFDFEGHRMNMASNGIMELKRHVASPIVLDNQRSVRPGTEDRTVIDAFNEISDLFAEVIGSIAGMLIEPSLVCVDFEDVRTTMEVKGEARAGSGVAEGSGRARSATGKALHAPYLGTIAKTGARGLLVSISAAPNLKMREINEVMRTVRPLVGPDAPLFFSAVHDMRLAECMRVTVVAIGGDR